MLWNKDVLLAKKESVYGTDAAPVVATDAHLILTDIEWTPFDAEREERNIASAHYGAKPGALKYRKGRLAYSVDLAGSGAATTPTKWATLLESCGCGAASVGASDVTIPLITGDGASHSIHFNKDILRQRLTGARGAFAINLEEGKLPFLRFTQTGLLQARPIGEAFTPGTPVLTAYREPELVSTANTTFSLDSYAALLRSFSVNVEAQVEYRSLVGQEAVKIADRPISGSLTIELPDPGVKDYFTKITAGTVMPFSLVHGSAAGKRISLSSSSLELGAPSYSEEQGQLMMQAPFRLIPVSGNDELVFKTS
jgi:hypothetical protein